MKKTKRCVSLLPGSSTVVTLVAVNFSFFLYVVEEDAGGAGKDSGADAAHPKRWLLTLHRRRKRRIRGDVYEQDRPPVTAAGILRWGCKEKQV